MRKTIYHYMTDPNPFVIFGTGHIVGMILSIMLWIGLPWYAKKHLSVSWQNKIGVFIGFLVMSNYLAWVVLELIAGSFDVKLHLPFHLCRFANLTIPIVMIWKPERFFQILYYWGMSGILQAAITPDATHGFPHFHYFRFFLGHNGMVLALIYAIVIYDLKPTVRGIWDAFLGINAFFLISIIVNLVLKANYFWICAKPATFSLLDYLGPWPWYILSSEFVALLHFAMAYLPFYFIGKRKK